MFLLFLFFFCFSFISSYLLVRLSFAGVHDAGWIHLDVKPENVCIAALGPEGEGEGEGEGENAQKRNNFATVRLIDFGHARPFPNGLTKIVGEAGSDSYAAVSVDWFLSFFFFFLLLEVFVSSLTSSFLLSSLSSLFLFSLLPTTHSLKFFIQCVFLKHQTHGRLASYCMPCYLVVCHGQKDVNLIFYVIKIASLRH